MTASPTFLKAENIVRFLPANRGGFVAVFFFKECELSDWMPNVERAAYEAWRAYRETIETTYDQAVALQAAGRLREAVFLCRRRYRAATATLAMAQRNG